MAWILNDIKSIIPSSAPELSPTPAIGDRAPQDSIKLPSGAVLLNFLRHLGCPFCEKTTRDMIKIANEKQDIQFLAVAHATQAEIDSWKKDLHLEVPKNMSILSDPERKIYAAYGVGELDFMSIFGGDVFKKVGELKKQGISNGLTIGTRYQNNAAFALDGEHIVRWQHVAKNSGDMSNLDEAVASISR